MKTKRIFPAAAPSISASFKTALRSCCVAGSVVLAIASAARLAWAGQALITFDDLPSTTTGLSIPYGYQNVDWVNFGYLDAVNYGGNPSGYLNGVISTNQVAYLLNGGGNPGGAAFLTNGLGFVLFSGEFILAWGDGLQVRLLGVVWRAFRCRSTPQLTSASS